MKKCCVNLFALIILSIIFINSCSVSLALSVKDPKFYPPESWKTPVKSQGSSGSCWAFAAIATLESYLAKNNLFTRSLSEQQLVSWATKKADEPGWHIGPNIGASSITSTGFFASGVNFTFADILPFGSPPKNISSPSNYINYRVNGIKYIPTSTTDLEKNKKEMKQAIIDYGAVSTGYRLPSPHAITIVGWDDASKTWLIKDSLTKSYRSLPYYTPGLLTSCGNYSITSITPTSSKEKIYQHDNFGCASDFFNNASEHSLTCANVYTFGRNEKLNAIMIESSCVGASCEIFYSPVNSDGVIPPDPHSWTPINNVLIPYSGYFTIPCTKPFNPPEGKGAIIVKINNSSNNQTASIGCECLYLNLKLVPQKGQSFVFCDKKFVDLLDTIKSTNNKFFSLSIKAITNLT